MPTQITTYSRQHKEVEAIFDSLPPEALAQLTIQFYKKGSALIVAGQYDDRLFIILEGLARIEEEYPSGLCMTYYKVAPGDPIGFYEILADQPRRRASIIAHTDVVAAYLPKPTVVDWYLRYPTFNRKVCLRVLDRLYASSTLMAECASYDLYRGTIAYLLNAYDHYRRLRCDANQEPVRIGESRQAIADFLGVDIRSVNRAVERLKVAGLVGIDRGKVTITPPQQRRLVEEKNRSDDLP